LSVRDEVAAMAAPGVRKNIGSWLAWAVVAAGALMIALPQPLHRMVVLKEQIEAQSEQRLGAMVGDDSAVHSIDVFPSGAQGVVGDPKFLLTVASNEGRATVASYGDYRLEGNAIMVPNPTSVDIVKYVGAKTSYAEDVDRIVKEMTPGQDYQAGKIAANAIAAIASTVAGSFDSKAQLTLSASAQAHARDLVLFWLHENDARKIGSVRRIYRDGDLLRIEYKKGWSAIQWSLFALMLVGGVFLLVKRLAS
jgi:hypothetical protein